MKRWIFAGYLAVEIAAFWAMVHFLGWGWAIVITVAAAAVGFAVLGRRAREIFSAAGRRNVLDDGGGPMGAISDSALFAGATALTIAPGVVSTLGGLILLAPPVRDRLRPLVAAKATQRATLVAERVTLIGTPGGGYRGGATVDGSVIDSTVVDSTVIDSTVVESIVVDTTVRNADGSVRVELPELPPVPDTRYFGSGDR